MTDQTTQTTTEGRSFERPVEQEKKKRPSKPCPDLPKGQRCHLCGGEFVCLQSWRKKSLNTNNDRPLVRSI